ncbi:unnamed protein product [Peronospora destructor]|uniref:protein-serine/threonine phosphatase n=1 Tax=Peronospora destructor TaxID=86335 RepID=A0AAV0UT14_9STRA|nr:unnamed protein product [Peronospora destructor]
MSYLDDDPWTIKDTDGVLNNGLEFGFARMQGWRRRIDDAFMAELQADRLPQGCSFFVVFDRHAGRMVADLASEKSRKTAAKDADPNRIGKAIRDALLNLDQMISATFKKNSNLNDCTAFAALITPAHIIVANAGDSHSFLIKISHAAAMFFGHNPTNVGSASESETQADSCFGQTQKRRSVSLENVSAEPDIEVHKIDKSEAFVVLVCNGTWDFISSDKLCAYFRQLTNKGKTGLKLVAEEIQGNCLRADSIVIVKFPDAKVGKSGEVAPIREERARLEQAERDRMKGW